MFYAKKLQQFLLTESCRLDPLYYDGSTLEKIDDSCEVEYMLYKPGFPLKMRDIVFFKYHVQLKDEVLQLWLPVNHSAKPPQKGKLRSSLEMVWRIKPIDNGHSSIHVMMNGNFTATLAGWVRKGLWEGTMQLHATRLLRAAVEVQQNGFLEVSQLDTDDSQRYEASFTQTYKGIASTDDSFTGSDSCKEDDANSEFSVNTK